MQKENTTYNIFLRVGLFGLLYNIVMARYIMELQNLLQTLFILSQIFDFNILLVEERCDLTKTRILGLQPINRFSPFNKI